MSSTSAIHVLLLLAAVFAAGACLIALAQAWAPTRQKAREIWPLYGSEFLIVALVLIPAALGGAWLMLAAVILAWRGLYEMFRLLDARIIAPVPIVLFLVSLPLLVAIGKMSLLMPQGLLIATIALAVSALIDFRNVTRKQIIGAVTALLFPVLAVSLTVALAGLSNGFLWIVFAYATVEINDAFALLFGKLFGKRRILPKLSPGKTEAGLIGGLVTGAVAGFSLAHWLVGLSQTEACIATAIALAAGLAGDLATSAFKRWHGKKDFPAVLKQHGGVLDIYDSLLFAAPAVLLWRVFA